MNSWRDSDIVLELRIGNAGIGRQAGDECVEPDITANVARFCTPARRHHAQCRAQIDDARSQELIGQQCPGVSTSTRAVR